MHCLAHIGFVKVVEGSEVKLFLLPRLLKRDLDHLCSMSEIDVFICAGICYYSGWFFGGHILFVPSAVCVRDNHISPAGF